MGRLTLAALIAALVLTARAQEPTFRVDVQLVRVLATVKNDQGQLAGSLAKEDFEIRDNGVPQQIRLFERHTAQPLSISLLVDASGSTAKDIKYEIDSVNRFLRALVREGNPDDSVALYSFNWEVRQVTPFTRNLGRLEKGLSGVRGEAGTALYDAMYLAAKEIDGRDGRHVMVIVTDGGDTVSSTNYHQALEAAHRADAVVYALLVMPITNDAGRNIGGENALAGITSATGGRVFTPALGLSLDQAFDDILKDLRTQYLLGYYPQNVPPSKDRFHKIEVKVRKPGLRAVSRTGYYEGAAGTSR